jgi:hypothetical protein
MTPLHALSLSSFAISLLQCTLQLGVIEEFKATAEAHPCDANDHVCDPTFGKCWKSESDAAAGGGAADKLMAW